MSVLTSGMHFKVALDTLLECPITTTEYPASAYTCEILGGPFGAGIGGEQLSGAKRAPFRIS